MNTSYYQREMTLVDLFSILRSYRWTIAACTASFMLLAGLYSAMQEPLYSAKVVMTAVAPEGQGGLASQLGGGLGSLIGLAGLNTGVGTAKEEAIAVLKSRRFTEEFIKERNLLPLLYPDQWDPDTGTWLTNDPAEIPSMRRASNRFDQKIRLVSEDPETGLLTLEILWYDRELAADWANDLVLRLNQRTREAAIEESERSLRYLNEQLERTNIVELRQAIFGLVEQHINRIMLANVREQYAFKVIDPAVVPDVGSHVSPRPFLAVAIAAILGLIIGVGLALLRFFLAQPRTSAAASEGSAS